MKFKITHPFTHLPAVVALVTLIVYVATSGPFPDSVPIHFGVTGAPDNWGSPWLAFGLAIGLSVFFIGLSIFFDELWIRQEKKKSFNWLSLFDELAVGILAGTNIGYIRYLNAGAGNFSFPWATVLLVAGISIIAAVALDYLRPFTPHPDQADVIEDTAGIEAELVTRLKGSGSFVYWDVQNPLWNTFMTILVPIAMIIGGIFAWFDTIWVSALLFVVALGIFSIYGGQRALVTRDYVKVRYGILGIRILNLKTSDIAQIDVHSFSPLKDFGGYGIRYRSGIKAYFLSGSRGVKLTMANGKKYLIGSNHPDQLAAVIRAVAGVIGQ
ncbi:MAG: DUF1648 domain-containing protein [Chloroflexi bacterium]|jgi:hypothetical protein|nr:DUF1648 domain-containing protein [Chloroflexota bacterium]MBT7080962.1 DUF1648 domain-containing protein [Chloroflexota bacterium]MBT7290085.1 DUF1648 domain-containing protein [Chloroflexota bacterium]